MIRKRHKSNTKLSGSGLRVGIVAAEFNSDITGPMLHGALAFLKKHGVKAVKVLHVPGSFEIPLACELLAAAKKFDALVALGCIIKGETMHDYYLASAVTPALLELGLKHRIPIGLGVITTNNLKQARARSRGASNKGAEAAEAAIRMARLKLGSRK